MNIHKARLFLIYLRINSVSSFNDKITFIQLLRDMFGNTVFFFFFIYICLFEMRNYLIFFLIQNCLNQHLNSKACGSQKMGYVLEEP